MAISGVQTVVKGKGLMVLDGDTFELSPGQTMPIAKHQIHAVKALTELEIIEIQPGTNLHDDDIEQFERK